MDRLTTLKHISGRRHLFCSLKRGHGGVTLACVLIGVSVHTKSLGRTDWSCAMLANWITLSRFPLLLINILILYLGTPPVRAAGVLLLFLGLMLDTVDGVVARKTGQTSLFGSVLDIAADRTYELVLWVCFAELGMIPVAIPLIVAARTTVTDAFRSIGVGQGTAPFAQHRTALGRFLVGSTVMRVGYSVGKITTFCGLALTQAFGGFPSGSAPAESAGTMLMTFRITAWLAVLFCVLRGFPVIIHSLRRYWRPAAALRINGR